MTLLERVKTTKKVRKVKSPSKDITEVALAWVRDEISLSQIAYACGIRSGSVYAKICNALKHHIKNKK